jgi:biopolymer transport protein ExbD
MTKDKKIYVKGRRTSLEQLEASLANIKNPEKVKTIIRADQDIIYGDVVKVMGVLQAAKVTDISVAVK